MPRWCIALWIAGCVTAADAAEIPPPQVAKFADLNAIIRANQGKVVLLDLWATY